MVKNGVEVVISVILLTSTGLLFLINRYVSLSQVFADPKFEYNWIIFGFHNILGYSTVLLPGYLVYRYIHKINYFNKAGHNGLAFVIRKCFESDDTIDCANLAVSNVPQSRTLLQDGLLLMFYFVGLQASFLTWGVLQEKVMTQKYENADGGTAHFTDSQFLVFVNRILAFLLSGFVVLCTRQPTHRAPLYKYVYCSLSNILSSWCQYEALKYVSFPYQVLAKATKTIPVMILGKIISKTKYESYEYLTALLLSLGMLFFMFDTGNDSKGSSTTTLSGVFLLCSYIAFDSFTSNWQGSLFKQYHMKPIQMMCGVNFFSCIFTAISLLQQGGLLRSVRFMLDYPAFMFDCFLLSLCSATGQLFIFKTIATFGPLIFVIITTMRQGFSVLLSCIIYGHEIHAVGIVGVFVVFFSIFLRIYCGHRIRTKRKRAQTAADLKI
ncbi:hypothetical protein PPYR_03199 [Photinus pyralis]|uniref:Adenosine 3'-phospho 5'-phosphosulfate transporter 1 n=1 Tax=Photinus pyralis TaxID=7054 RepID=A0A1Y1MWX6_PHOPY|nr:adenosine 3'-phospho 5'-phosphosulfate transporter 1 [Photinus pyralis]XP_031330075.1 adenosine 3'-phospho 5'-phosphosulfate transporter 1 [Photinus pyralis]KAB0791399.1 hypothetical protein PPYR_03199 [Photinus pyralis]